jgi:prevent-host-death family protein
MNSPINVHDAKTHFSQLLERAHNGEEIILAKASKAYAKLVPLDAPAETPPRQPGLATGFIDEAFFEDLPADELEAWSAA